MTFLYDTVELIHALEIIVRRLQRLSRCALFVVHEIPILFWSIDSIILCELGFTVSCILGIFLILFSLGIRCTVLLAR